MKHLCWYGCCNLPIGSIEHGGSIATYCDGEVGAITKQLYDALTAIQEGRIETLLVGPSV